LGYVAKFSEEYTRERQQLILRVRQEKQVSNLRSASVNNVAQIQLRHSL
jgi:hypothetical protein